MSKKIYITHADDVSLEEAIVSVKAALISKDPIRVGEMVWLTNGCCVDYVQSKHPTFHIWRQEVERCKYA